MESGGYLYGEKERCIGNCLEVCLKNVGASALHTGAGTHAEEGAEKTLSGHALRVKVMRHYMWEVKSWLGGRIRLMLFRHLVIVAH